MSRRVVVSVLALALVAAGCAPMEGERVSPAIKVPSASGPVRVASADRLNGEPNAIAADADGAVVAVDALKVASFDRRGRVLWSVPLDGAGSGSPALVGDNVVVPFAASDGSGGCVGLDRETGATDWTYAWPGARGVAASAGSPESAVCLLSNGMAVDVTLDLGLEVWVCTFEVRPAAGVVADGTAFALAEAADVLATPARVAGRWTLATQSASTGEWRTPVDFAGEGVPSSAVSVGRGQIAFAFSHHSRLAILAPISGRVRLIVLAGARGFTPASVPTLAGRILLIADRTGRVFAVDLTTRRVRWTARAGAALAAGSRPFVVGAVVIVLNAKGGLHGYGLADGRPVHLPDTPGRVTTAAGEPGGASAVVGGPVPGGGWIARWVAAGEGAQLASEPKSGS